MALNKMDFVLQKEMKTPFYYYDMGLLKSTLETLKSALQQRDNMFVHYAVKANAHSCILKQIATYGLGADCVSGGEIEAALNAGFSPEKIVFAGVGKSDEEITLAITKGIYCIHVESLEELEIIASITSEYQKKVNIALRINPNVKAHTHEKITTGSAENKFGISVGQCLTAIQRCIAHPYLHFKGLHFHIGSQILDMNDFALLAQCINPLLALVKEKGYPLEYLNVGGGLGIDYECPDKHPIPDFHQYIQTYLQSLSISNETELHFELGRSIVGQCGSLITKVLYVKQGEHKQFVVVDAGMTELIRPAMYHALHQIENLSAIEKNKTQQYDIVGPICESSDVFATHYPLPLTHRGDILAIRSAGAYGASMASQYNCRPLRKSYFSNE